MGIWGCCTHSSPCPALCGRAWEKMLEVVCRKFKGRLSRSRKYPDWNVVLAGHLKGASDLRRAALLRHSRRKPSLGNPSPKRIMKISDKKWLDLERVKGDQIETARDAHV